MQHAFLWDVSELIGELRAEFPEWNLYVAANKGRKEAELDLIAGYMTDMMLSRFFECDSHITLDSTEDAIVEGDNPIPLGLALPIVDFLMGNRYHKLGCRYDEAFANWISSRVPEDRLENSDFISLVAKRPCSLELILDIPET